MCVPAEDESRRRRREEIKYERRKREEILAVIGAVYPRRVNEA